MKIVCITKKCPDASIQAKTLRWCRLITSDGSMTLKRRNVLHTLNYTNHKTTASKVALVRKNHVTYGRHSNSFFL